MREIRTEIDIARPPEEVWAVLTNFESWKVWNPIVNDVTGMATQGSRLHVTMRGKDGKDAQEYAPLVTLFQAPKAFRWRAVMMAGFLMTNDKIFELEETPAGTKLIHIETFSGLMVPLFWGKMKDQVPIMLKTMNKALKKMVEGGS